MDALIRMAIVIVSWWALISFFVAVYLGLDGDCSIGTCVARGLIWPVSLVKLMIREMKKTPQDTE